MVRKVNDMSIFSTFNFFRFMEPSLEGNSSFAYVIDAAFRPSRQ